MAKLLSGMAFLKLDGQNYSTDGEFTANIKNKEFTEVLDADGQIHYSEKNIASIISGSLLTTTDLDASKIADATNVVVQVEFKNGQTALLRDAIFTGDAASSAMDGKMNVEWKGIGKWI